VTKQTHEPGPGRSHEPGPGRWTADAAFIALTKEIAQRNEQAQKEGRKLRAAREQEKVRRLRWEELR
jgi:hypothetical protein